MALPVRKIQFDVQGFCAWLADNGCEVCKPTNKYEVVRYRAYFNGSKRPVTHLVYCKENGLLTWMQGTQGHYITFLEGAAITGNKPPFVSRFDHSEQQKKTAPATTGKGAKLRSRIIARDGDECWFCGSPMGDDCTIEHLIPKAKGGLNALANYVAAHSGCNAAAADKPLVEKIAMRERMRMKV